MLSIDETQYLRYLKLSSITENVTCTRLRTTSSEKQTSVAACLRPRPTDANKPIRHHQYIDFHNTTTSGSLLSTATLNSKEQISNLGRQTSRVFTLRPWPRLTVSFHGFLVVAGNFGRDREKRGRDQKLAFLASCQPNVDLESRSRCAHVQLSMLEELSFSSKSFCFSVFSGVCPLHLQDW